MPVSHPNHLPPVLHIVHGFSPRSVLDVGVGIGAVGLLVRQMLDISRGNLTRDTWSTRLEGVEIFPAYRNLWQNSPLGAMTPMMSSLATPTGSMNTRKSSSSRGSMIPQP